MEPTEPSTEKAMLTIIGDGEHAAVVREAAGGGAWLTGAIVAIGSPKIREHVVKDRSPERWANVVHARASVSPEATLGGGVFVGPGAIVNRGATIGAHAIVNSGAVIEHGVVLKPFVNVNPGAVIGGGARIGARTVLGLGCRIRDHIKIGSDVTVGMGAVVVNDVPDGVTVMGCPAKVVKRA